MGNVINAFKQCLGFPTNGNNLVAIGADVDVDTGSHNSHISNANKTNRINKNAHNKKTVVNQQF